MRTTLRLARLLRSRSGFPERRAGNTPTDPGPVTIRARGGEKQIPSILMMLEQPKGLIIILMILIPHGRM